MEKIILIAYDLNPELGSECGIAHIYLRMHLKRYNVIVFTNKVHESDILKFDYGENVSFRFIDFSFFDKIFARSKLDIISNWNFCRKAGNYLLKSPDLEGARFIHVVTPEGFFAFNNLYRLGIKYIIGPINGGLKSPKNFRKVFRKNIVFDFFRDNIYKIIVKLPGWNKYYKNVTSIIISDRNLLAFLPEKYHDKTFQIFDVLVDPDEFLPDLNIVKQPEKFNILFTGRLIPKKGVYPLLESFKKFIDSTDRNNISLTIVGKGPLLNEVKAFIEQHQLEKNVFLFSNLSKNTLIEKYQAADIYCLPTLREPGGLAILEAMSCGLPVVTSNYGGPAYSVTPECGIKIDMKNYKQYVDDTADAFSKLYKEPALRKQMGINSRDRIIKEFSIESVEKKLTELCNKIELA